MRTKKTTNLAEALWPGARRATLGLLLLDPSREWHLREIARRTGVAPATAHAEVRTLLAAGIVARRVEPGRAYYRADTTCPIFPELRQIVLKTVGLVDVLRAALADAPGIEVAFVYGSFAAGREKSGSDVDIIAIGDISFGAFVGLLHPTEETLAREVNPTVYPVAEFRAKLAAKHHFLSRIMQEPKLFVIGGDDDLRRLGGVGMGDTASGDA